ncbi:Wzz/FepE/Etk N-terminal domain-containing protein [Neobacillus sp. WH10]|uniref:YveK family protein n=1 Tax=Neobacillus sp. WH10 TaxID=3047873 RepID=UPI0024C14BC5|nr:Wzz/FepE/Etk N-terminal domain-containing protein [Neobacillus sp. WH10]WHY76647.1 Wzz/FepE/Etk N-terminal domain-containing protein [Neobacillus sp. WH10]
MDIVKTLKKRWNLILLTTLLAGLIGMIVSFYILKPVYEASTQILVNQNSSDAPIDIRLLQGNVDLINTYSVIIKSPAILEKVIDTLNLKQSVAELNENLIIKSQENSQVFTLVVEDREAAEAVKIANAVSEIFQKEIPNIMNVNNVSILAKAELNEKPVPVKPNALLNIAISTAAGLLAGIAFSLVLDLLDNTLRDDKDVAVYLGLPVLGSIKEISKNDIKGMEKSVSQKLGSETIGQLVEKKSQ